MMPFEAFLWSIGGVLIIGVCVIFAIYRQKRNQL